MENAMIGPFDMHCHVGDWETPDFCGRSTGFDDLVRLYEKLNFSGALITTTDRAENRKLADQIAAYDGPLELKFAFWVLPTNLELLDELRPLVSALKIHPSFLRKPVTDPVFTPFLERAADYAWPVVVHCGRWQEIAGYGLALDVAREFPSVNFVLSHMGGDAPCLVHATVDRIVADKITNVFLGTESIRQFDLVQYACDQLGPDRVVFGSDYNLNSPSAFVGVVMDAGLDDAATTMVLGKNARRLLTKRGNNDFSDNT